METRKLIDLLRATIDPSQRQQAEEQLAQVLKNMCLAVHMHYTFLPHNAVVALLTWGCFYHCRYTRLSGSRPPCCKLSWWLIVQCRSDRRERFIWRIWCHRTGVIGTLSRDNLCRFLCTNRIGHWSGRALWMLWCMPRNWSGCNCACVSIRWLNMIFLVVGPK